MNQSTNTRTLLLELKRRVPHQRFVLALLVALGLLLTVLGNARAQNAVVNGDFNGNAASFTVAPGYATGAFPNPGDIPNWTNWAGAMSSKGLNDGLTGPLVLHPFGPTAPGTDTYLFMQNGGNDLGQYLTTLSPNTLYALVYSAASRDGNNPAAAGVFQVLVVSDDTGSPAVTYYNSGAVAGNIPAFQTYAATFTTQPTLTGTENIQLLNVSGTGDNSVDFKGISVFPIPTVAVTPASTNICSTDTVSLVGTYGSAATNAYWSTSGSGTFSPDTNTMTVTYTPSPADATLGTVTLTLTSTGQVAPAVAATATAVVKVDSQPAISAGPNSQVIVVTAPVTFSVTATGGDLTYQWAVQANGGVTFVNDPSGTNANYTIASTTYAQSNSQYQVTVSGPCGTSVLSTNAVLSVELPPTASAGPNQTLCHGPTAPLGGSVGGMATGGIWTSSGSGSFVPSNTDLNAIYYLSVADQSLATITLTLTTTGQIPPAVPATATVVVTINKQPAITSGPSSLTVCQNTPATFSVAATGGGLTYQWQVSTDTGLSFHPTSPSGTDLSYTIPSATMAQSNSIYRVVVAGLCGSPVVSTNAVLAVKLAPTVNAGGNQTICAGATVSLTGTYGGSATNAYWSSTGTGSWSASTNTMANTYTPSTADVTAGTVSLKLTSKGQPTPCGAATDTAVVTINGPVIATQPANQTVCAGSTAAFSVTAPGAGLTYQWSVSTDNGATFNPTSATDTNASYTTAATSGGMNSNLYNVAVTGPCGAVNSTNALLIVNTPPTVNAGGNQTICAGATVSLSGSFGGGATNANWRSSGTGTFAPNTNTVTATYTPSAADETAGTVTLTLTSTGQKAPCTAATDTVVVTINGAYISVGPANQTVCAGSAATFSVTALGAGLTYQWQVSTDNGATFNPTSATDTNANYTTPATDGTYNSNLYNVVVTGACVATSANALLIVNPVATVSAGGNQTICAGATVTLAGSFGGGATNAYWASSGTGTFAPNTNTPAATYTPSAADKTAGTVTLTLTSKGQKAPCGVATDTAVVTINGPYISVAPANQTVCAGSTATFSVTALGAGLTYQWQVSTDNGATFNPTSATDTNANYTTPATDGTYNSNLYNVVVTGACVATSANALLIVNPVATVSAGGNQTICAGATVTLAGSFGGGATNAYWASSGTGTFAPNTNTMAATYTPSAADKTAGTVTLTLTSKGQKAPCGVATDVAVVTIQGPAIVSGPASQTVCAGSPVTFSVTTGPGLTYQWNVSTDNGSTFNPTSANDTNANYIISPTDGTLNSNLYNVALTGPCGTVTSTNALLKISLPATVSAGGNQTICAGATVNLTGTYGGSATNAYWHSSGTGTWSPNTNTMAVTYTPSTADKTAGTVTLTLTSKGQTAPCGAATDTAVVTIGTPAPTTTGATSAACGGGVDVILSASGSGGTLGWYSDAAGTVSLNNTGPTYTFQPTVTTTVYVQETNALGCASAVSPVTATVYQAEIANAGTAQVFCGHVPELAGLNIRAWNSNSSPPIDGASYDLYNPNPAPGVSTYKGTLGYATLSINMPNTGPVEHFALSTCGVAAAPRPTGYSTNYYVEYRGQLYITNYGHYSFATASDDGSALWLDPLEENPSYGEAIVKNSNMQGLTTRNSSAITLLPGYHNIIIRYYQGGGGNALQVYWDPNGGTSWSVIPGTAFYHDAVTLAGSVSGGATAATWSGAGMFSTNNTKLVGTLYEPTMDEIAAGSATVTLTTTGHGACAGGSSTMTATINPAPTAIAGVAQTICSTSPTVTLAGSYGGSATNALWTSPGGGTFLDATVTNTTYTLSSAEINAGSATVWLTAFPPPGSGCTGGVSNSMTITIITGGPSIYAGPDQIITVNAVQLAGVVGNGGTTGSWSDNGAGGSFDNANSLTAIYTPSPAQIAFASGSLTLTSGASVCIGPATNSTMHWKYVAPVVMQLDTNTSKLIITLCMDPHTGTTDLKNSCVTKTNAVSGYMSVALGTNGVPTTIALADYDFTAMGSYEMTFGWSFSSVSIPLSITIGSAGAPVAAKDYAPDSMQPVAVIPDGSGYGGTFTLVNLPFQSSGYATYTGTATGTLDLGGQAAVPSGTGSIYVTNEVATVHLDFSLLETFYESGSPWITGYATFHAIANATSALNTPSYLVWTNFDTTGLWSTTNPNWKLGTANWDNIQPDNAIFGSQSPGIVTISEAINARSLWFQVPGYTIAASGGGSLALKNASAITNDVAVEISAPIISGSLNKYGAGTLTLSGPNTFTGPSAVYGGQIVYAGAALNGTSPLQLAPGFTINLPGGTNTMSAPIAILGTSPLQTPSGAQLTFNGPITLADNATIKGIADADADSILTFNAAIGGNGDLTFDAEGTADQHVTFVLAAANTWSGNTYVTNNDATADVQLTGSGALPASTVLFMSAGFSSSADWSVFDLNGRNQTLAGLADGPILGAPTIVSNSSATASILTLNEGRSHLFSGVLGGNLALTKTGLGTATLAGANTYSGNTIISAGTLALSGSGTLGSASTNVNIAVGATLDVSGAAGGYWSLGTASLTVSGVASDAASIINGPSGGTCDLGTGTILVPSYDVVDPALTVPNGILSLNSNVFLVNTPGGASLPVGYYPLIQVASSNTVIAGTCTLDTNSTALGSGYGASIVVSNGQVLLDIFATATITTITVDSIPSPQVYGNTSLGAHVLPIEATGDVTFYDGVGIVNTVTLDGSTGVAVLQTNLAVGTHSITAQFSATGDFTDSSSGGATSVTITARPVLVTGTRTFDGTALMPMSQMTFGNNVDGANCTISGTAVLAGKNTPSEAVIASTFAKPTRVHTATANQGTGTATSFSVTVTAPASGNTMIAVIATRGSAIGQIGSVTQTGATWKRVSQAANTSTTTEIWYAPNVQGAGTSVSIVQTGLVRMAGIVMEYSGVFYPAPPDQTNSATGNSATASTGTTPTTTSTNELWIGSIAFTNSGPTLAVTGTPAFTSVTSAQSGNSTAANNAKVYALEYIATATGTASSGGTLSTGGLWSGAIATFFGQSALALSGSRSGNYTVASFDPASIVTITPLGVAATTVAYSKTYDATTNGSGAPAFSPPLFLPDTASQAFASKDAGASVGLVTLISDGNGGSNYTVTSSSGASGVITQKPLSNINITAVSPMAYAGPTTAPTLSGSPGAFLTKEAPGSSTTDGAPYTGDDIYPAGTAAGHFATPYVGANKAITVTGVTTNGAQAGDYSVIQQVGLTCTVTQEVVTVGGSVRYNGTTSVPGAALSVANANGDAVTLSGAGAVASKNVGTYTLSQAVYATPTRVQAVTGNTATVNTSTSFSVTVAAPKNGDTMIAVITTHTNVSLVTGITQTGATWTRAVQASTNQVSTEIWYAPNVQSAGTSVSIAQTAGRSAAIVMEYSGLLTASVLDQIASATNNTGASTGTTPTTTQTAELWLGAIGLTNSAFTLTVTGTPLFTSVTYAQAGNSVTATNSRVYALEYIASATGAASSGGTVNTSGNYAGVIATFKASQGLGLTLGGGLGTNYTMAGASGSVTITPTNLTVTAAANTKLYDGTTNALTQATAPIQASDSPPVGGWTEFYLTRNVGTNMLLTPAPLLVQDGNGGANYNYVAYTAAAVGEIDPTNFTVTAVFNDKTYDGTTTAAALPTVTGNIQVGDTTSATNFWETYNTANAAPTGLTLTPAGVVTDGNGGSNYYYNFTSISTGEIDQLNTTTLLTVDINPSGLTTNVTFTATVAGTLPTVGVPTGFVEFYDNGGIGLFDTEGPLVPGSGSSSITAPISTLTAGNHNITAYYEGDGNYKPSWSDPVTQVVTNSVIYSTTNSVGSFVSNHDGTYTLCAFGTPGAEYYLVTSPVINAAMNTWTPVVGSTNTASGGSGQWCCTVSNPAPAYYRPVAVNPAP